MVFSYGLDCKRVLAILITALLFLPALLPITKIQAQTGASEVESTAQAKIIVNPNQGKRGDIIEITLTNQVVQIGELVTHIKPDSGIIILMRDVGEDGRLGLYGEFHLIPAYEGDVQPDWVEIQKDTWRRSYYVYAAAMEGPNIISCGDLQTPFTVLSSQPAPKPGTIVPKDPILVVYPAQSNVTELEVFSEDNEPIQLSIEENPPSYLKILIDPQVATPSGGITRFQLNVTLECSQTQKPDLPSDYNLTVKAKSEAWEISTILTLHLLPAKWLIMFYFCAENNLFAGYDQNWKEICDVAFDKKSSEVSIVSLLNRRWAGEEISRMGLLVDGDFKLIGDWGPTDMSSPNTLRRFLEEAKSKIPSERTHLILFDHGQGIKGALQDFNQGKAGMSISEMAEALRGLQFDIISFDACLMAEIEVLYSLRASANYFTCSELIEPGTGYNYTFLQDVFTNPDIGVKEYLSGIVNSYVAKHRADRRDITLSAIDSSKLPDLAAKIDALSKELRIAYLTYGGLSPDSDIKTGFNWTLASVVANSSGAVGHPFVDIGDFATKLANEPKIEDVYLKRAAQEVKKAVEDAVVVSAFSEGWSDWAEYGFAPPIASYYGLTIFLWRLHPNSTFNEWVGYYRQTSFSSDTSWETFVYDFAHSWELASVLVRLDHPAHELYVHVYDDYGGHAGFNATSESRKQIDFGIPGVIYTDFPNGTEVLLFPLNVTQFRVVVDGSRMEEPTESYTLTLSLFANGTTFAKTIENSINLNTSQSIHVEVKADGFEVGETTTTDYTLSPIPMVYYVIIAVVVIVIIAVGVTVFLLKRRRHSRLPPPPPPNQQIALCPMCRFPLTYIPQYQRWYCQNCKEYV